MALNSSYPPSLNDGVDFDFESTDVKNGSGIVYARNFDGDTLSQKIANAYAALGEGGRILVTPPKDGSVWEWGSNLTLDVNSKENPVEIDCSMGTEIVYRNDGWCLTIDGTDKSIDRRYLVVNGGVWRSTDSANPDGCFQLKDATNAEIHCEIRKFENSNGDSTAVSVESHTNWVESIRLSGRYKFVDRGIDFKPASVTGGSGDDSFVNCLMTKPTIHFNDFGIRIRGNHPGTTLLSSEYFTESNGARCLVLDGDMVKGNVINPRFDNTAQSDDVVAIETGPNYIPSTEITNPQFNLDGGNNTSRFSRNDPNNHVVTLTGESDDITNDGWVIEQPGFGGKIGLVEGDVRVFDDNGDKKYEIDDSGIVRSTSGFGTGNAVRFRDGTNLASKSGIGSPFDGANLAVVDNNGTLELRVKFQDGSSTLLADNA